MRVFSNISVIFVLFVGLSLVCTTGSAHAQTPDPASALQAPQDEMDEIPDEYIKEANAFYDECSAEHKLHSYYNCECLSLAYLDKRIELGPTETQSGILSKIQKQCRDAVGAAGPAYTACLRKANMFQPGTDPEKYCECVANTYVESLNQFAPQIRSRSIVRYQTYAYTVCNNPEGPRPEID